MGDERIATIHAFTPPEMLLHLIKMPTRLRVSMPNPRGTMSRAMRMLPFMLEPGAFNRREVGFAFGSSERPMAHRAMAARSVSSILTQAWGMPTA